MQPTVTPTGHALFKMWTVFRTVSNPVTHTPSVPRCPKEVYPHVPTIINICLKYLTYDPNYNYDDEDEDENAMDADGVDEDYQGIKTGWRLSRSQSNLFWVYKVLSMSHYHPETPLFCCRVWNMITPVTSTDEVWFLHGISLYWLCRCLWHSWKQQIDNCFLTWVLSWLSSQSWGGLDDCVPDCL